MGAGNGNPYIATPGGTSVLGGGGGYTATATATSGHTYTIRRDPTGTLTRTCMAAGSGGCLAGGTWQQRDGSARVRSPDAEDRADQQRGELVARRGCAARHVDGSGVGR